VKREDAGLKTGATFEKRQSRISNLRFQRAEEQTIVGREIEVQIEDSAKTESRRQQAKLRVNRGASKWQNSSCAGDEGIWAQEEN
jgi:hypothetical protein